MLLKIDHHSGVPAYRQLVEQIALHIATGRLVSGDEMPSTRTLSSTISLNPMTISKAYGMLERDGLLERQRGKPLVVAENVEGSKHQVVTDALADALKHPAALVQQLGISNKDAIALFKKLLAQNESK